MRKIATYFSILVSIFISISSAHADSKCHDSEGNRDREEVCRLTNIIREKRGLRPLSLDQKISAVAQSFATDMKKRGFFDHTDPDGKTLLDRYEHGRISWRAIAENIAMGQSTPAIVMKSWTDSAGHLQNITNSGYTRLGVGRAGRHWVQNFAD